MALSHFYFLFILFLTVNCNIKNILTHSRMGQNSPVSYISKYQMLLAFSLNFLLGEKFTWEKTGMILYQKGLILCWDLDFFRVLI